MKRSLVIAVSLALSLSGCAETSTIGMMMGGSETNYTGVYQIDKAKGIDVFAKDDELAKKLGFGVSEEDKVNGVLRLTYATDLTSEEIDGKYLRGEIDITGIGKDVLEVKTKTWGNYQFGTRKESEYLFSQVKDFLKPEAKDEKTAK